MYRSIPKPPIPLPGNPPGIWLFWKFWSNSPLCCQFREWNAPPVRASKRVKFPTLQGKQNRLPLEINRIADIWKQVLQIFSHYEFLVQLLFAPRFKQRHIPQYKYINRQQQKKPTCNRQEQRPVNAAQVLKQRIANSFCFRPLTDVLAGKSNAPPGGPHLGSNSSMYGAWRTQMPGGCPGGMGGFGIDWYIIYSIVHVGWLAYHLWCLKKYSFWSNCMEYRRN